MHGCSIMAKSSCSFRMARSRSLTTATTILGTPSHEAQRSAQACHRLLAQRQEVPSHRRHGVTYYFKSIAGTEAFALEYQAWLSGKTNQEGVGTSQTRPGSVSALVSKYYRNAEWANLSDATKATYRGIMERFRQDHGDKPVKMLERRHVREMHAGRANTPAAANNLVR